MRRHNQRLYRAARAILRDDHEAEDVMQEAYVNAYSHLAQFDGRAKFSTWLTKIAVYEALARARRRGRYEHLDDSALETLMPTTSSPDPERLAFGRELGALIESAVDTLGDGYREVFMLRQVEGLSTAETAEVLGVSEDVVKTRFSRARSALQRDLLDRTDAAAATAFTFGRPVAIASSPPCCCGLLRSFGPLIPFECASQSVFVQRPSVLCRTNMAPAFLSFLNCHISHFDATFAYSPPPG